MVLESRCFWGFCASILKITAIFSYIFILRESYAKVKMYTISKIDFMISKGGK